LAVSTTHLSVLYLDAYNYSGMASVFPLTTNRSSGAANQAELSWETDVVLCAVIEENNESLLEITLNGPLPATATWETLLLVEYHAKYSGVWKIRRVSGDRMTVTCLTTEGKLGETTPHYSYAVSRTESCGLAVGPNATQEVMASAKAKVSIAPPLCLKVRGTILSVSKVDTVEQTFTADVSFECRLRGISTMDNLASVESLLSAYGLINTKTPVICLLNTDVELERWETFHLSGVGARGSYDYTFKFRGKGTFVEEYELRRFPFYEQLLNVTATVLKSEKLITMEANEEFPSFFVASNFQMSNIFSVAYWDYVLTTRAFSHAKESASGLVYPRITMAVLFVRKPMYYVTNIALPMMVLTYLAFLSFAVGLDGQRLDTPDRLSITLTLLLTAVAYKFVVASAIPQVSYLTWLDQYISFCFGYLCVIIAENAIFPFLETRPGWSLRGDHELYVFILLAGLFTLVNVLWFAYVWRALHRQAHKHRNIVLVEKIRRELAQQQMRLVGTLDEKCEEKGTSRERFRELVVAEARKRGVDVVSDADLCHLLGVGCSADVDRVYGGCAPAACCSYLH
jgi:hypothetical protein